MLFLLLPQPIPLTSSGPLTASLLVPFLKPLKLIPMHNATFTITDLFVLVSILATGLALINFYQGLEYRRKRKKLRNRYPSAARHPKKYQEELNQKLDITENFYHN